MADAIYVPKSDILDLITEENEAGGFTDYSNYSNLWDEVDDMPAADVQPVKHGRWIAKRMRKPNYNYGVPYENYICSQCAYKLSNNGLAGRYHFCPNCGAKMDGGD